MLTPQNTYIALLVVQALHLLHHRIAKRHISLAEVVSAIVLCVPPGTPLPAWLLIASHLSLIVVQTIGSIWIKRLSPNWSPVTNEGFLGIGLLILLLVPWPVQSQGTNARSANLVTQKAFFNNLRKMCGQQFEGVTEFPQNADHPMVGKKLLMSVESCTEKEIRIPFQVGDDKSRTWILTLGAKGLLFKHDHRHPDGTPDKITMYGGWAAANGNHHLQRFPADADTIKLIPEAATNIWTLQIIPEKRQFMYYLERNNQPRYRAYFDLKTRLPRASRNKRRGHDPRRSAAWRRPETRIAVDFLCKA